MKNRKIYALGFFDGVHLGHQALLENCRMLAEQLGARPAALTFDVHPQDLVQGNAPVLINTPADRCLLLEQFGMTSIHTLQFDHRMRQMPWQDFFRYLTDELGAAGLVCGHDFRFGYQGQGNAQLLQQACLEKGIPCVVVPEQIKEGIRISSTCIRRLLQDSQLEKAVEFLGHPHILSGTVISGRKLGRTIGVPTANVQIPEGVILPASGVYACKVRIHQEQYLAVTNVGDRPTVGGHKVTIEPWLLDFEGDLYGRQITVEFYKFLRPEEKFDSLEALRAEILRNAEQTRQFFSK